MIIINSTDLVISDDVSNVVHELGHMVNILVVSRVIFGLNTIRNCSKLVLDPTEGAGKDSVQDRTRVNQGDRHEQVRTSHGFL